MPHTGNMKHGMRYLPEYGVWSSMKFRCDNRKAADFKNYGGRGIKVCERWKKFENFIVDVGRRPSERHTLERLDNNKGYELGNVVWATRRDQCLNKRNNRVIEFDGRAMTLEEWSMETEIPVNVLHARLGRLGWSVKKSLTTPIRHMSRRRNK